METSPLEKRVLSSVEVTGDRTVLTCSAALALADELGVDAGEIGRFCNERKIKIVACRLGCFK